MIFTPTADYNGPASFTYTVQDNGTTDGGPDPRTDTATVTFNVAAANDAPVLTGSVDTRQLNDRAGAVAIFGGVSVNDIDAGESDLVVKIQLDNPSAGAISGTGWTDLGNGVYQRSGLTVAQANAALDDVRFTPADVPSGTVSTTFTVSVDDGSATAVSFTSAALTITGEDPAHDLSGDGRSDLLWRNLDGTFTTWDMNGSSATPNTYVNQTVANDWDIQAVGDFNGDGRDDILWRNSGNGHFTTWEATEEGFRDNAYVDLTVDKGWSVQGVGDFNGDGRDDLMWRNSGNGHFTTWSATESGGFTDNTYVNTTVDNGWAVQTLADFNGDGRDDIMWRNSGDGRFTIWSAKEDGSFDPNTYVNDPVGNDWSVQGAGDFNGDGRDDILWRNDASGHFTTWLATEDGGFAPNNYANTTVSNDWDIDGIGDFNGDGRDDILWRNEVNGHTTTWQSTGTGFDENSFVDTSVATSWSLAVKDFDIV